MELTAVDLHAPPAAVRPVRWGICGTGRMAQTIAAELQRLEAYGARLTAVSSRSRRTAEEFAHRFAIPRAYDKHADLARDSEVDVVYIATPPSLHCQHVLACIENHKSVLCEKPFSLSAAQAVRMIQAARERDVFLMEAMWTRFLPAIAAARAHIAGGLLGPVCLMVGGGGFIPPFDPSAPLFDRALGGGVLLDAGVYLVSLTSMLLGPPTEVIARGSLGRSGVDEEVAILLQHGGGARALLYVSLHTRRSPDLEIMGEAGRLRLEAPVFCPTRLTLAHGSSPAAVTDYPVEGSGYGYELRAVMNALAAGRRESPLMPLGETLTIMSTLDTVRASLGLAYPEEGD